MAKYNPVEDKVKKYNIKKLKRGVLLELKILKTTSRGLDNYFHTGYFLWMEPQENPTKIVLSEKKTRLYLAKQKQSDISYTLKNIKKIPIRDIADLLVHEDHY